MQKPKVFRCADHPDRFAVGVEPQPTNGHVRVAAAGVSDDHPAGIAIIVDLSPEDIPALCAELRRVAKLAKQGGGNG